MDASQIRFLVINIAILFSQIAVAWQTPLQLNLIWPAPHSGRQAFGDLTEFPCAGIPVPENQPRDAFPITGAGPQWILQNDTAASSQCPECRFVYEVYIGQVSSDVSVNKSGWAYIAADILTDRASGLQCGTDLYFSSDFRSNPRPNLTLSSDSLIGADATLGFWIYIYDAVNGNFRDAMYQCSYVSFVAADPSTTTSGTSTCVPHINYTPTSTVEPSSTTSSTTMTNSPSNQPNPPYSETSHRNTAKLLGIAVPIGVIGFLTVLATFMFLQRRRRAASSNPTVALGFFVNGHPNEHKAPMVFKTEIKDDKKTKDPAESGDLPDDTDGVSIRSEPLPPYTYTITGGGEGSGRV